MNNIIKSTYKPTNSYPKLDVENIFLCQPEDSWTYSHHPFLTFFNGTCFAMWSNGMQHEDHSGQRVMYSYSQDFMSWSRPEILLETKMGKHSELILTPAGFHIWDNTIQAYFFQYELSNQIQYHHEDLGLFAITSNDGKNWSAPIDLNLKVGPNHGPQRTASGRLIISSGIIHPYTDDTTGLSGWKKSGIYPPEMKEEVCDDSEWIHKMVELCDWPRVYCEGSFYQTDDGVLHMLYRTSTEYLWVSHSYDDGESWSQPEATDFTNDWSKFHVGRLPDGRFYWVGNPDSSRGRLPLVRNPLVISTSEDGVLFDKHYIIGDKHFEARREGEWKGGDYGYPHTIINGEYMHVIVSHAKESVSVFRFKLNDLK